MARIEITNLRFRAAEVEERRSGLLGYLSFVLGEAVRIDGVTLRQKADGHLTLSYPARRDQQGRDHPSIRPISDESRTEIERQVFAALPRLIGKVG